jgi:hypothetical protein
VDGLADPQRRIRSMFELFLVRTRLTNSTCGPTPLVATAREERETLERPGTSCGAARGELIAHSKQDDGRWPEGRVEQG